MAKFCVKCGAPLGAGPFCVKCGAHIRNVVESAQPQSPPPLTQTPSSKTAPLPSAAIGNGFTWLESKPLSVRAGRREELNG